MKNKKVIAKISVRVDYSDGTHTDVDGYIVPKEVSDHIISSLVDWRTGWSCTFKEHEEYLKCLTEWKNEGRSKKS